MREANSKVDLGMLSFSVFFALDLTSGAHEGLHARLALYGHGLLVGVKLAAFSSLLRCFLCVSFSRGSGLLSVSSTHVRSFPFFPSSFTTHGT
jgi:hypothetical protein